MNALNITNLRILLKIKTSMFNFNVEIQSNSKNQSIINVQSISNIIDQSNLKKPLIVENQQKIKQISIKQFTKEQISIKQFTKKQIAFKISFDLKKMLFKFDDFIFVKKNVKKKIVLKKLRFDSISRRIIIESFNEFFVFMKKMINFTMNEKKIKNKIENYKIFREMSMKQFDIVYRKK